MIKKIKNEKRFYPYVFLEIVYKKKRTILFLILLISLFVRLYAIFVGYGANHYSKIDELEAYQFGMNLYYFSNARIFGAYLPGPWQSFFVWFLIKLTNTVYSLYFLFALIGTWTVYLIYWLSNKLLGIGISDIYNIGTNKGEFINLISLSSALFYAIMPWPVKFSVSFWNPHFFIPFITLFLGYFADVMYVSRSKSIMMFIFTLSILPFFHMEIVYGIFPVFVLILVRYLKPHWLLIKNNNYYLNNHFNNKDNFSDKYSLNFKYLLIGLFLSILIYIPFLYFDWKNNFYILAHYLKGSGSFYKFRPETFKIFSNIIIVMSNEISRFTGHNFTQYKYFLNKAFGFFIIGFLMIAPSFIIVLFAYIRFFKTFIKNKIKLFIGIWIISTALLHILSGMPSELRYTIIWFPLLIIIINLEIFSFVLNKKVFINFDFRKPILLLFVLTLITGFYINISHFYQERYPDYKNKTRLIPSLIIYEKIKKSLISDYFNTYLNVKENRSYNNTILHLFTLKDVFKKKTYSLYYFYPFLQSNLVYSKKLIEIKNRDKLDIIHFKQTIKPIYYISMDYLFLEWQKSRQKQITSLIKRFINSNMNLITDNKKNAKYIIWFIDKKYYKKNKNNDKQLKNSYIIGVLSNCYIVKSRN